MKFVDDLSESNQSTYVTSIDDIETRSVYTQTSDDVRLVCIHSLEGATMLIKSFVLQENFVTNSATALEIESAASLMMLISSVIPDFVHAPNDGTVVFQSNSDRKLFDSDGIIMHWYFVTSLSFWLLMF